MRNFSISIDIDAPPDAVWRVMIAVDRWHEWTPSITSVKILGDRPFGVGSRAVVRQPKFPPALWTVTAIEPGRSFTWTSSGPGFRAVARHTVEPTSAGSRATLAIEFFGIFGGLFGKLTHDINDRYLALEANGLKARSENPQFHHHMPYVSRAGLASPVE
jgi:uncharacterized protein YndB with AHSA1/START domain